MNILRWSIVVCSLLLTNRLISAQDRNTLVNNDRDRITEDGFWIYNDIAKGMEEAAALKKPLLIVFRCIPCEACAQLDAQVIENNAAIRKQLSNFVCVRVVYTNGLDLSRFQFDYDQSWAAFFMNADGAIYGRYGTRSHQHESEGDVSLEGFMDSMQRVLQLHQRFSQVKPMLSAKTGPASEVAHPEDFPKLKEKYTSSLNYGPQVAKSCIHCHQVGEAWRDYYRVTKKTLPVDIMFPYPNPKILGLVMDPKKAATVEEVVEYSLASEAGFQAGDILNTLQGQPLVSIADIQWVLHRQQDNKPLQFKIKRAGVEKDLQVVLPMDWKELGDISWRVSTWSLRRMVTGGLVLETIPDETRKSLQLADDAVGLRVKHVGQFDAHAAAKRAGFKLNDVFVKVEGMQGPVTETKLITHLLRSKKPGDKLNITVVREGKELELNLPIQE